MTAGNGNLSETIWALFGKDTAKRLLKVDREENGIHITGYVSEPDMVRANRNMQNFFINRRFVICKTAMAAISEACKGSVMVGKFPSCVLNLDMSFNAVDVNVHPTKLEVRFVNERPVFDAVYHSVKTALMNGEKRVEARLNDQPAKPVKRVNPFELAQKVFRERDEKPVVQPAVKPAPKTVLKEQEQKADRLFSMLDEPEVTIPKRTIKVADPAPDYAERYQRHIEEKRGEKPAPVQEPKAPVSEPVVQPAEPPREEPKPLIDVDENYYKYLGEAFKTYIIVEKNDRELMLIDKHAAHERIIYEKLKKEKGSGYSQLLLTPLTVTLNKIDYNAVMSDLDVFREAGFDIEDFGSGSVIVRSAPQYLPMEDIEPSVIEMAGYLSENKKEIRSEKMDWIYANVSCRAAIKGGNRNTEQELIDLARRVEDEDIRHCPHGRPVCIILKKHELERMFGRIE